MKKLLITLLAIFTAISLISCQRKQESHAFINGVNVSEYSIVYSDTDTDYAKRAAEFIQSEILARVGVELTIIEDSAEAVGEYEIVVGNTSREISSRLDEETEGLQFSMLAEEKQVALEGDYFIIAAAAYYFVDTYVPGAEQDTVLSMGASVHEPIVKEAKNFILLIGDGMGVNQTLLYDELEDVSGFSDGEDAFYGYMLPYMGYSRTDSLSGTTDSAAGGTALATGYKTTNDTVGLDKDGNELQSLTELAMSLGKSTAVMSTETQSGATPSAFSAHTVSRDNTTEILTDQAALALKGTMIDCGFHNQYNQKYIGVMERHIEDTLSWMDKNDKGFFLMYEEAHIDKHCHNNDMDKTYLALIRFNQAIARFMEYAFYNPETMIIITADHETGDLRKNENGELCYNREGHSSADVPVFVYGYDGGLFDGQTIENIQIAHTVADLMGVEDFGDQSQYQSLTGN